MLILLLEVSAYISSLRNNLLPDLPDRSLLQVLFLCALTAACSENLIHCIINVCRLSSSRLQYLVFQRTSFVSYLFLFLYYQYSVCHIVSAQYIYLKKKKSIEKNHELRRKRSHSNFISLFLFKQSFRRLNRTEKKVIVQEMITEISRNVER